jgi:hypothetical protein
METSRGENETAVFTETRERGERRTKWLSDPSRCDESMLTATSKRGRHFAKSGIDQDNEGL